MHLTRSQTNLHLPIPRKGTRYIARPANHVHTSITVVSAVRDMLKLAHTAREVEEMIKDKVLKINGIVVRDIHDSLKLFNIFEADKRYTLRVLPTGRFNFVETKGSTRLAKVIGKTMLRGKHIQVHLHDGTNLLHKTAIPRGSSVELDTSNHIVKIHELEKGKKVLITSGRSVGREGTIQLVRGHTIELDVDGRTVSLDEGQVFVL